MKRVLSLLLAVLLLCGVGAVGARAASPLLLIDGFNPLSASEEDIEYLTTVLGKEFPTVVEFALLTEAEKQLVFLANEAKARQLINETYRYVNQPGMHSGIISEDYIVFSAYAQFLAAAFYNSDPVSVEMMTELYPNRNWAHIADEVIAFCEAGYNSRPWLDYWNLLALLWTPVNPEPAPDPILLFFSTFLTSGLATALTFIVKYLFFGWLWARWL